jgi:hypothetical protein
MPVWQRLIFHDSIFNYKTVSPFVVLYTEIPDKTKSAMSCPQIPFFPLVSFLLAIVVLLSAGIVSVTLSSSSSNIL